MTVFQDRDDEFYIKELLVGGYRADIKESCYYGSQRDFYPEEGYLSD